MPTILLAEDDEALRYAVEHFLSRHGYDVMTARDAEVIAQDATATTAVAKALHRLPNSV